MIDGVASRPFSAKTIPPPLPPEESYKDVLIENSRRLYSTPRISVEEKIAEEWSVTGSEFAKDRSLRKDEHRLSEILKPASASAPLLHKPSDRHGKSVESEPSLSEIVAGGKPSFAKVIEGEGKRERQPKHFNRPDKKKVDISDLKKALQKSLGKDFGDKEEVKEKTDESII